MKKKYFIWLTIIFTLGLIIGYCINEVCPFLDGINQNINRKTPQNDTIKTTLQNDTLYKSGRAIVIKNTEGDIEIYHKTPFEKTFDDFKTPATYNKKHPINYNSNPIAKKFKTVITDTYNQRDSADFAGHYVVAKWGCGSSCSMIAIVDIKTGRVYEGVIAAAGYDYRPESKLLVVNPPNNDGWFPDWVFPDPEYYIFENNKFIKIF